jgi:vacuolar-type H+-ATPase subunit F/Vma7
LTPVLIGTDSDARGFALAGVDTHVCRTREEVEKALDRVLHTITDPLVIFSKGAAELIADRCAKWRRDGSGPLFVALPG